MRCSEGPDLLLAVVSGPIYTVARAYARRLHREPKAFEAIYSVWWYIGPPHHIHKLDFIGTDSASSTPILYLTASLGVLLLSCFWRRVRLSHA